jgi:hypothetical protein
MTRGDDDVAAFILRIRIRTSIAAALANETHEALD